MLNPNLYEVTRESDRWVCRPSMLFARLSVVGGFGMSAFLVYIASIFFGDGHEHANVWIGAIVLAIAVLVAGLTVW